MGREIQRVPVDFNFPIGASYHDDAWRKHYATCPKGPEHDNDEHDECDVDCHPPRGDGWQLWQTVSDGPLSPVFATPDELIDWMCLPDPKDPPRPPSLPWAQGWRRDVAEPFVRGCMCAPSIVAVDGRVMGGAEFVTRSR